MKLLGETDSCGLLSFLSGATAGEGGERPSAKRDNRNSGASRVVKNLERTEPEKHGLLAEFERLLREGALLPTLSDLRSFGVVVGKSFKPKSSRKASVDPLLTALAKLEMENLKSVLARIPRSESDDEQAFRRLSQQLIGGGPSPTNGS